MGKAYNLRWDALAFIPLALMVVLYSRIVHTLWLKRNDNCSINYQQMVSANLKIVISISKIFLINL